MASLGILKGLFGGAPAAPAAPVDNQLVASFGTTSLGGNTLPQNMVEIPAYRGLAASSFRLHLSVTDTTGATTAPSGVNSIENVIKNITLQTASGKNIVNMDGSLLDISNTARYLDPQGLINNSPTPADSATSTAYTDSWDITVPFAIANKHFPLKLFVTYNTLSSRATTLNSMTSQINALNVYMSYHPISVLDQAIVNQTIPVSSTGNINLATQYLLNRLYYMQAYVYGDVQASSATDSPIGATGQGVTFTPDGSLYMQNSPLQSFINLENSKYPNTVSTGVGHETGMVNLFTNPFKATSSTQFNVGFTSAPSTGGASGQSNQIRSIWVMDLQ